MSYILQVINILSILTILGMLSLFVIVVSYLLRFRFDIFDKISFYVEEKHLWLAFGIAIIATGGSLFLSEIGGFVPCKLCWFQRIFMYPLIVLLGIGIFRRRRVGDSVVAMSIIGSLISLYHYFIQYRAEKNPDLLHAAIESCGADGVSCTTKYVNEFGFISIPFMALIAFLLILTITLVWKKR